MGADAAIHVFDYGRYRSEVVPAFVELLRSGEPPAWLSEIIKISSPGYDDEDTMSWTTLVRRLRERPVDIAAYCDWLGADLRYTGTQQVDRTSGKQLACASLLCPARDRCPLHRDQDRHGVEGLNALHDALVSVLCLGESQFVGRTVTPNFYRPVLERNRVPAGDPLQGLLAALATRGAVLGYRFGITEGIHGWLDPAETLQLAESLDRLDLPRYEVAFTAMSSLFDPMFLRHDGCDRVHDDWRETSLSFVRTVATIAAGDGKGVLWGNDVSGSTWTELYHLRDPRESPR